MYHIYNIYMYMYKAMKTWVLVAIIIVLFIAVLALTAKQTTLWQNSLEGMWIGKPDFVKKADIDGIWLYAGPVSGGKCTGQLIMHNKGQVVYNNPVSLKFRSGLQSCLDITESSPVCRKVLVEGAEDIMPCDLDLTLDLIDNTMLLTDGERAYLSMYKSSLESEIGKEVAGKLEQSA